MSDPFLYLLFEVFGKIGNPFVNLHLNKSLVKVTESYYFRAAKSPGDTLILD